MDITLKNLLVIFVMVFIVQALMAAAAEAYLKHTGKTTL